MTTPDISRIVAEMDNFADVADRCELTEGNAPAAIRAWMEQLKAIAQQPSNAVPEGYVVVPARLTAENGAKAALSGEFHESIDVRCPDCDEDYDCEVCGGDGVICQDVPVSWTTIKEIHRAVVAHFVAPVRSTQDQTP